MTDARARVEAWMDEPCPHDRHYSKKHCPDCLLAFAAAQRAEEREAWALTGVALIASTDMLDGHSWVRHADDYDLAVVWCQWCGVHRGEVGDWIDHPQCPALAAIRARREGPG